MPRPPTLSARPAPASTASATASGVRGPPVGPPVLPLPRHASVFPLDLPAMVALLPFAPSGNNASFVLK